MSRRAPIGGIPTLPQRTDRQRPRRPVTLRPANQHRTSSAPQGAPPRKKAGTATAQRQTNGLRTRPNASGPTHARDEPKGRWALWPGAARSSAHWQCQGNARLDPKPRLDGNDRPASFTLTCELPCSKLPSAKLQRGFEPSDAPLQTALGQLALCQLAMPFVIQSSVTELSVTQASATRVGAGRIELPTPTVSR